MTLAGGSRAIRRHPPRRPPKLPQLASVRRIAGLYDELRPDKPRSIDDERVAELIRKTLHTKPADGSTRWRVRAVASEAQISPTSVHRYFKLFGLQPHRSESFKLSTVAGDN